MLIASLIFFRSHSTTESIEVCANQAEKGELFFVFRQLCPWSHYYFSVKQARSLCLTNIQLHIYQTWEPSHFGFSNIHIVLKTLSIYHSITMHTKTRLSQWNFIQAPIRYDTNGIFFFFFFDISLLESRIPILSLKFGWQAIMSLQARVLKTLITHGRI